MTFGMTPTGFPPAASDSFPNFIQFQSNGDDLGGPDADTVNLGSGLTATRGVGEDSNVVTISADSAADPGGSAPTLVVQLAMTENAAFDGVPSTALAGDVLVTSDDAVWSDADGVTFQRSGVYEVSTSTSIEAVSGETVFPTGYVSFGTGFEDASLPAPSSHSSYDAGDAGAALAAPVFSDTFIYDTGLGGLGPKAVSVFAHAAVDDTTLMQATLCLRVRRLGGV